MNFNAGSAEVTSLHFHYVSRLQFLAGFLVVVLVFSGYGSGWRRSKQATLGNLIFLLGNRILKAYNRLLVYVLARIRGDERFASRVQTVTSNPALATTTGRPRKEDPNAPEEIRVYDLQCTNNKQC
ncbi:hypothetical protein K1719_044139 [Acacia pycnantha]|nr:hypothetical protein K1719_044139 [Acacia pycnantha]